MSADTAGFRCPICLSRNTRTIEVRLSGGFDRRRRKECECGNRFTTYEVTAESYELLKGIRGKKITSEIKKILEALSEVENVSGK